MPHKGSNITETRVLPFNILNEPTKLVGLSSVAMIKTLSHPGLFVNPLFA